MVPAASRHRFRPRRAAVALTAALAAAAPAPAALGVAPATAAAAPAVGFTLDEGPGGETRAFDLFTRSGATALEAQQPWSTLEPRRGRYALGDVRALVQGIRPAPADRMLVIPAAIETDRRSVPADLRHARWDAPAMIGRYRRLIDRLAPLLDRQTPYVTIANEADDYLTAHPAQLPAFRRFAAAAIAELHRRAPSVKVGVTVTFNGLTGAAPRVARALASLGDVTIVTYYPIGAGYRARSPHAPLRDIPRLVALAHGRRVVVQEAGYPTDARIGGSPARQATFVSDVFRAVGRERAAIPFVSFYELFDLPGSGCRGSAPSLAFLCSLGLRERGGAAKPGWDRFVAGVRGLGAR